MSAPPTLRVAEELLTYAREHERQARFWRKTARRVLNPRPGERVELGAGVLRFVSAVQQPPEGPQP